MQQEEPTKDRRSSQRLDMEQELVTVDWSANGESFSVKAVCIDVSSSGVKIHIDQPLDIEQQADITFEGKAQYTNSVSATVVHCKKHEQDLYEVAFKFIPLGDSQ